MRPRNRFAVRVEALERRLLLSASSVSANLAITIDPGVQQFPSIAADPLDAKHLVVSYMDRSLVNSGYAGIGVAVSRDAGKSWQHGAFPLPSGFGQTAADPITRFDDRGHVFVSFMAATFFGADPPIGNPDFFNTTTGISDRTDGFQANNGIFVARSDDGGAHWNAAAPVVRHFYTGAPVSYEVTPDLAIDTYRRLPGGGPNPHYGEMYETWTRIYAPGEFPGTPAQGGTDVMVAVSPDGGATWQTRLTPQPGTGVPVTVIQDPQFAAVGGTAPAGLGYADQSHLTIGPDGDVYESCFSAGDFAVFHSDDDAISFAGPDHVADRYLAFGPGFASGPGVSALPGNQFRTYTVRDIVADPTRPGTVYAVENIAPVNPGSGTPGIDPTDIFFARSVDYGQTWQRTVMIGGKPAQVLNDDNGGQLATQPGRDVNAGQVMPRLSVDAGGDIAVIWYDTRHDPARVRLDVFGTISTDGGATFSPNFRVTDTSFDANAGVFTDAAGQSDFYLGDWIGLSAAGGAVYAAWTDTRNGNQDVYAASFPMRPAPEAPNDRFEPNDAPASATELGSVVTAQVPRLVAAPGDDDWFRLSVKATGNLTAVATSDDPRLQLRVDVWNASGTVKLADGSAAAGGVAGRQATLPIQSGKTYLVHVSRGSADASVGGGYSMELQALTADVGAVVYAARAGTLAAAADLYYLASCPAAGSIQASVKSAAGFVGEVRIELLDPQSFDVLATGSQQGDGAQASYAVSERQVVLVHVSGATATSAGPIALELENLDQFSSPLAASTLLPDDAGPSQIAVADLNGDGSVDLVVSNTLSNTVSVYPGNKDGTFQAPRQFVIGAFALAIFVQGVPSYGRGVVVADVNRDGMPDIVVSNYGSSDVSVLLGHGDCTFAPQRRFDATPTPMAVAAGDFDRDGNPDLVVLDAPSRSLNSVLATLRGRGDGRFAPPLTAPVLNVGNFSPGALTVGDFNADGIPDVGIAGISVDPAVRVFLGNGDGTFRLSAALLSSGDTVTLASADFNGDGKLDLVVSSYINGQLDLFLGNGDGTFAPVQTYLAGQVSTGLVVADLASVVTLADGSVALGPPDGHPDVIVANSPVPLPSQQQGTQNVAVLPALFDADGNFLGLGSPVTISRADDPAGLATGDFNGDGVPDFAVADLTGIRVIFGQSGQKPPANDTPATARDLGTVVHLLEPTLTIVPGHEDSWYRLLSPVEAGAGGGPEVLDFSALFEHAHGAGLGMEVLDAAGNVVGTGAHLRIAAAQGQLLYVHVMGLTAGEGTRGAGAYTLDIDVLAQLVSVAAPPLLPGASGRGSGNTLVLTFQGDRLDPAAARDPSHYQLALLGTGGRPTTSLPAAHSVVYDPSANVEVATGVTYPTAVRQTVTLVFDAPLPAGSYVVTLSPAIVSQAFSDQEAEVAPNGHPLVQISGGGGVLEGSTTEQRQLVGGANGSFDLWSSGTPFLTQLHDDLGTLLDAALSATSDDPSITAALLAQIVARVRPTLQSLGAAAGSVLFIWLDPPPPSLDTPFGRVRYDPASNEFSNGIANAYVSVAGNVELIAKPLIPSESVSLTLQDVAPTARGGVAIIGPDTVNLLPLTDPIRGGQRTFVLGDASAAAGLLPFLLGLAETLGAKGVSEVPVARPAAATVAPRETLLVVAQATVAARELAGTTPFTPVAIANAKDSPSAAPGAPPVMASEPGPDVRALLNGWLQDIRDWAEPAFVYFRRLVPQLPQPQPPPQPQAQPATTRPAGGSTPKEPAAAADTAPDATASEAAWARRALLAVPSGRVRVDGSRGRKAGRRRRRRPPARRQNTFVGGPG